MISRSLERQKVFLYIFSIMTLKFQRTVHSVAWQLHILFKINTWALSNQSKCPKLVMWHIFTWENTRFNWFNEKLWIISNNQSTIFWIHIVLYRHSNNFVLEQTKHEQITEQKETPTNKNFSSTFLTEFVCVFFLRNICYLFFLALNSIFFHRFQNEFLYSLLRILFRIYVHVYEFLFKFQHILFPFTWNFRLLFKEVLFIHRSHTTFAKVWKCAKL